MCEVETRRLSLGQRAALGALSVYKYVFSPAITAVGIRCRHEPTCSSYSRNAVIAHGAWYGSWMTLARFLRCRPGGSSGYDPAPETLKSSVRWYAPWRAGDWRGPPRSSNEGA